MSESPYFGHEGDDGEGIQWGMDLGAATADMAAFQAIMESPEGAEAMKYDGVHPDTIAIYMEGTG